MHALPEVRHQIAECARFPALIERIEAFRNTVGGWRNLIGIDGVQLFLFAGNLQIPEDERLAADGRYRLRLWCRFDGRLGGDCRSTGREAGGFDAIHRAGTSEMHALPLTRPAFLPAKTLVS